MQHGASPRFHFGIIQWLLWTLTCLILLIYCYYRFDRASLALYYAVLTTLLYAGVVYGNSHWLLPFFFRKSKIQYAGAALLFITAVVTLRVGLEYALFFKLLEHHSFFDLSSRHVSFSAITVFFAFLFGVLLRLSIDYVQLLQHEQARKREHTLAELHLLKYQVQPHFLFNALNNIYYLAYAKSDQAPECISRLSDAMRYLVEEASQERVSLRAELEFIQDYMEVERIRLPHPLTTHLHTETGTAERVLIPPMLLIPLVENAFKHGVDRTKENNEIRLTTDIADQRLRFTVWNRVHCLSRKRTAGTGLANLRKRLDLLYGQQYTLTTTQQDDCFISQLTIPLP